MAFLDRFNRLPDEGRSAREIHLRNKANTSGKGSDAQKVVNYQISQHDKANKTTTSKGTNATNGSGGRTRRR